jgi:hypothetical protein
LMDAWQGAEAGASVWCGRPVGRSLERPRARAARRSLGAADFDDNDRLGQRQWRCATTLGFSSWARSGADRVTPSVPGVGALLVSRTPETGAITIQTIGEGAHRHSPHNPKLFRQASRRSRCWIAPRSQAAPVSHFTWTA